MPDALYWLDDALMDLDRRGLRRTLAERQSAQCGGRIVIDDQSLVNFGSNDYLGLAGDPRLAAAVKVAVEEEGWGASASPLVSGRSGLHAHLERALADFEGTEAALLFPSGYAANVGTITSLVGKGDAIYSDELNHASIIDGCRLSGAAIHIYAHGDVADLQSQLTGGKHFRRRLIVTDSLFSMHGDYAPLAELVGLASKFDAMFMVDEAHATGVFGEKGRGCCERDLVENDVDVRVSTLSKSLGSAGGFVAGPRKLIDWLTNRARPYVFSTASPAATAAAGLAALEVLKRETERGLRLLDLARELHERLADHQLIRPDAAISQIVPVNLGDADRTMAASAALRRRGFFVPAIRPPSVPVGQSLLRISLTCLHTEQQIDDLVAALREVVENGS
jgi:8-amino-7-oxononanoate synthase